MIQSSLAAQPARTPRPETELYDRTMLLQQCHAGNWARLIHEDQRPTSIPPTFTACLVNQTLRAGRLANCHSPIVSCNIAVSTSSYLLVY